MIGKKFSVLFLLFFWFVPILLNFIYSLLSLYLFDFIFTSLLDIYLSWRNKLLPKLEWTLQNVHRFFFYLNFPNNKSCDFFCTIIWLKILKITLRIQHFSTLSHWLWQFPLINQWKCLWMKCMKREKFNKFIFKSIKYTKYYYMPKKHTNVVHFPQVTFYSHKLALLTEFQINNKLLGYLVN